MKEVKQISLNGMVFFLEEDGYFALKKYINNLEQYYTDKEDGKEIIEDIQIRFSELLLEKRTFERQAMTLSNIEEVISILGYPENFETEETVSSKEQNSQSDNKSDNKKHKRLYRDPEHALLGGICSGLSYYFGIDTVIFRLIFVIFGFFSVGFWVFAYIILWLIIPSAKTTQQRYEMKGEALNIEDIENRIKDGLNEAKSKINGFADNNANAIKNTANEICSIVKNIFKFIIQIVGFCIVFASTCVIVILTAIWFFPVISLFKTGTVYSSLSCVHEVFPFFGLSDMTSILCFIVTLLPFVLLFLLGLIFLVTKMRKTSAFSILAIFILWIVLTIILGIGTAAFIRDRQRNTLTETTEIRLTVPAQNIIIKANPEIISDKTVKVKLFDKYCLFVQHKDNQYQVSGITNIDSDIIYTNDTNVVVRVFSRNFKDGQIYDFQKNITIEDSIIYIPFMFPLKDNYWSGERINVQLLIPARKKITIDKAFIFN